MCCVWMDFYRCIICCFRSSHKCACSLKIKKVVFNSLEVLQRSLHMIHRLYCQPLNKCLIKTVLHQLCFGKEKELTCATCDILNLFPKREKSSIASFVFRAWGSSKEEYVIIQESQVWEKFQLFEKFERTCQWTCIASRCQSTWRVSMCASAPLIIF